MFSDSADLMAICFWPTFLQLSNLADSFKRFYHKINAPLYRYMHACACIDGHVDTQLAHTQRCACNSCSDKGDFLPSHFKAFLVLTEYPRILLSQPVLVHEEVFPNIDLKSPNTQCKAVQCVHVCAHRFKPQLPCPSFSS